ncbi:MAG: hypothetical protein ACRCRR_03855 [Rickettsia sp.]
MNIRLAVTKLILDDRFFKEFIRQISCEMDIVLIYLLLLFYMIEIFFKLDNNKT